ncbi:unnamed protein product [Rotaria sp. Silwood2]|nr:unnamed protein product [Rotaria sp. Silwood2]CAF2547879.1 unnamed protein product [Rotaria sp. Silwood2]CAF2956748.1 unnamed protein product [Rotaria sp. Silwood2]CAF3912722.1 unnamed protein product [Rotaria sp. Silwood2]CAF4259033.1 unnamed protein product [Rotaria sp. Silwood2]
MTINSKFVTSSFLKYRSIFNLIIHRCLSSKQPTLYETLKVIESSTDVFIQPADSLFVFPNRKSVFGGQLIGSTVYAAQKTLTRDFPLHSLHSYFLTAADNSSDISYTVTRLRDGQSFETRSVTARQDNRIVFECSMNFHQREKGNMEHQLPMPHTDITPPEKLLSLYDHYQNLLDDKRLKPELKLLIELALQMPARIDVRYCHQRDLLEPEPVWPARELVWIKSLDPLPDYSHIHRSAVAYCSDRVLLNSAFLPYAVNPHNRRIKMQASLDHSMWFHDDFMFDKTDDNNEIEKSVSSKSVRRSSDIPPIPSKVPVRADDWLLYELECPIHMNNRAWTFGRIWTRNGRLIVTCAQEGVIRYNV